MEDHPSSENPNEPLYHKLHTCNTKIYLQIMISYFVRFYTIVPCIYIVGHVQEKKMKIILKYERSGIDILPICIMKELGIINDELN